MRKLCRVLFSRYAISALTILLSLISLLLLLLYASTYSVYFLIPMVLLDVAVILSIINRDANPEYKLSWAVISLVIPFFGAALYCVFYSRKQSKRETRFLRRIYDESRRAETQAVERLTANLLDLRDADAQAYGKASALVADDPIAEVYRGTRSDYFPLGELMLEAMLADLSAAKKYIFLEYFIIEEGVMWNKLYSVLRERAEAGVDVRILYDDIGSMKTLPASFPSRLAQKKIKCCRFAKVTPRVSAIHNNRDHRKICVIDGTVAYTGGINVADEYINATQRFGHWKDGGIRIKGFGALGFVKLFLTMWDLTVGSVSNYIGYFSDIPDMSAEDDGGYYIPFGSGPAPVYARPVGKNAFLNVINQAERYVYITTPYLIIDYTLTEALRCAARRGVEVVIVTPAKADKKRVKVMTKSAYPSLMCDGVKIMEYTPGFIHEKIMISDDKYAIVGSINFDYRSLVHHYEDALWMYNTKTVISIRDELYKTMSVSHRITDEEARLTPYECAVRNTLRLFAPLL